MANITETATWEANVYEWATTDPVQGGTGGIDNLPTSQLANRTQWLKGKVDALLAGDLQLKDAYNMTSNTTLTSSYMGAFINLSGSSALHVTIPAFNNSNALKDGQAIIIKNNTTSGTPSEIYTSDSGLFDRANDTTLLLSKGDTVIIIYRADPTNPTTDVGTYHVLLIKGDGVPTGTVSAFAGAKTDLPDGYLLCDGSIYAKADYPDLATLIDGVYGDVGDVGGNPLTDFFVPDLRGSFVRGLNTGSNSWANTSPNDTGRTLGTYQADELKSHLHTMKKYNKSIGAGAGFFAMDDNGTDGSENTTLTGGSETRPKNIAMNYIIKY